MKKLVRAYDESSNMQVQAPNEPKPMDSVMPEVGVPSQNFQAKEALMQRPYYLGLEKKYPITASYFHKYPFLQKILNKHEEMGTLNKNYGIIGVEENICQNSNPIKLPLQKRLQAKIQKLDSLEPQKKSLSTWKTIEKRLLSKSVLASTSELSKVLEILFLSDEERKRFLYELSLQKIDEEVKDKYKKWATPPYNVNKVEWYYKSKTINNDGSISFNVRVKLQSGYEEDPIRAIFELIFWEGQPMGILYFKDIGPKDEMQKKYNIEANILSGNQVEMVSTLLIQSPEEFWPSYGGKIKLLAEEHGVGDILGFSLGTEEVYIVGTEKTMILDKQLNSKYSLEFYSISPEEL